MNAEGRAQARLGQRSSAIMRDPRSGSAIEASPSGKARLGQSLPLRRSPPAKRVHECRRTLSQASLGAAFGIHTGPAQRVGDRSLPLRESAPRAIPPSPPTLPAKRAMTSVDVLPSLLQAAGPPRSSTAAKRTQR
jgi:hypothetical protein